MHVLLLFCLSLFSSVPIPPSSPHFPVVPILLPLLILSFSNPSLSPVSLVLFSHPAMNSAGILLKCVHIVCGRVCVR